MHHIAVFVSTTTIIRMQVQVGFAEVVSSKEMMQHADGVRSLAGIDLLSWNFPVSPPPHNKKMTLSFLITKQWHIQDLKEGGGRSITREAHAQNF